MTQQRKLFGEDDLPDWRAERADGMERADAHAALDWKSEATHMIETFARERDSFFGWEITVELRRLGTETPTDRALGPLLVAAAKRGLIEKSSDHAHNPLAHGCPSPRWRSRIRKAA
jgi:hypothetical protein